MSLFRSRSWFFLLLGLLGGHGFIARAQNPEPAGWYTGDMHVHRSCGGAPVSVTSIRDAMSSHDLAIVSLLADMGNGEVQNPTTDLPKVNGLDDPISTAGRIVHWDAEWHWDATYTQYPHQALGGHIVALGLSSAVQVWQEYTKPIFDWAHARGGIAGFAHLQFLGWGIPDTLNCCIPVEYPVEVALGSCDFISEDLGGSDSAIDAYYRLLNCGFRPGFAGGSDYPCGAQIGALLTYVQVSGALTYDKWVDGIAAGRTVVSRNGHNEFLDLKVNGTSTTGDEIALGGSGSLPVTITWTAKQNISGIIELVHNGVVVASQSASVASGSPATLSATVNFPKSGWLAARRMGNGEHQVHTAAVFIKVANAPVRASVDDANFYVQWMDTLLTRTSVGGQWASFFPTQRSQAQARYQAAKTLYQQIATEAAAQPLTITTGILPDGTTNVAYSTTLAASGGTTPYSWSLASGSLPTGLTLNSGSGTISGTPTTVGTFNFTARATDASNPIQTATQALSIAISTFTAGAGTFGNTADGTQSDYIWDNGAWINTSRFQATSNTTVSTMHAKVAAISGKYKCAIYTDSGAQPSRLLRSSTEVSNPSTGWQAFPLSSSVVLTNGSYYWLAIWSDNANARVYYSSTSGTLRWTQVNYGAWPDPISTSGPGSFNYCIYATGTGATLTNIAVTPVSATILAGATQQFTATGTYSDGSTQDVTSQAAWTSSNTGVATINSGGLATGVSPGSTTISAVLSGKTGNSTLNVQPAPLTITTASLPSGTVTSNYTITLTASGGTVPYSWSIISGSLPAGLTLNPSSGTISGTPTTAGTFNFTAQVTDASNPIQTATKPLSIAIAPILTSIAVTPATPGIFPGGTQQFTATGTYSDSSTQNITTSATWVSSNTAVATINATGLASGASVGSTPISASLAGRTGSTTLNVVPAPVGLGDYRSVSSGVWANAATWQTNNGSTWVAASQPPTNTAAGVITVRNGHTVTVSASITVDQVVVEAGGQATLNSGVTFTLANGTGTDLDVFGAFQSAGTITINSGATINVQSGGTYQHNLNAGTIPTATWAATSTCLITGTTTTLPSGLAQSFGHFTWNCAGQSAALNLETSMNIAGDFTVSSSGSSTLRLLNSSTARTITVTGNYRQTGGTFNLKNNSGNAALNVSGAFIQTGGTFTLRSGNTSGTGTVTVAGNFSLTTGTFNLSSIGAVGTLNVGGDFSHSSGTITETSSGSGAIIFTSGLHTYTSGGTVANTLNFTVNSGATLTMGASLLGNGSIGTFTLSSGGTLGIGDPAGITTSGATGNIRVTGARSFNTGANYIYNGSVAQVPGNGLPATVNNLTIANAAGLAVNSTYTVNGTCVVNSGARLLGSGRIINGALILSGTVSPGTSVGRFTTDGETWNGGASYNWEISDATGAPGTGWDLESLTTGKGIDLQATTANPFIVKLITLTGASPGLAANFSKSNSYLWTIAITTNATVTNFAADKFLIDATQFSNDFAGGSFSVEQSGAELRLKFDPAPGVLTITTTSFPNGTHNVPYTATLTANGGTNPYSYAVISGSLPLGVTMNPASGAITGTPTATGVFNFTAQVTDSSNPIQTATKPLSITVVPTLTSIAVTPVNPSILSGATQQFTATGTYSDSSAQNITSQAAWTSSSNAVATINASGLATSSSPGTSTISASLAGRTGNTLLTVQPLPLAITTTSLPNGNVNASYSATVTANGGTLPYNWSTISGSLPPGLTLNPAGGAIAGTPSAAGTFNFTIQVTDASNPIKTATQGLSITIVALPNVVTIWPSNAVPGTVDAGADSSVELGVKFRSDIAGTITGIRFYKASANTGTHVGNLWTSGGALLATVTFTGETVSGWQQMSFGTPVTITSNTVYVASYHANTGHYSEDLNYFASAGTDNPPLHALANGVSGPNGVYVYGASSAFPDQTWSSANYWVDVLFQGGPPPTLTNIVVTPANPSILPGATQQFTANGTYSDGTTQNITSQATWISSNTVVATINASGLATAGSSGTTTISAVLAGRTGSTLLTVQSAALTITTTSLATGTVSVAYSATLTASGGTTPYSWSLASGLLPPGLTLNASSGAITGTPTTAGTSNFTVQVSDNSNPIKTTNKALSITITPALSSIAVTPSNPTIVSGAAQQFTATGTYSDGSTQNITSQVTWSSSSNAVATVNSSGLATGASPGNATISASLAGKIGNTLLTVQPAPLTITTTSLPNGTVNVGYSATITASGGTTPYTWSLASGSLPTGLTLNAGSGAITGTPTVTGTFNFAARVSDSSNPVKITTNALGITITTLPTVPILVLTNAANPFSFYYSEILLTEGLNEFELRNISTVSAAILAQYDVVVLGQMTLTAAQVTTLSNWVYSGGNLIATRPDQQLAGLLGLTVAGSTLAEGYLLVNTASGPGIGIVGETIQYHGTADRYTLGSATSLATLYSDATTATANPAVTLRSVGPNGGQAAAFTFDLARSVCLTRQGNPAWAGQDRDGVAPLRCDDLFFGSASNPQPNWVNLNKVAIPQADEQQRLLANMITSMDSDRKLLPRFWYFPHGHKAAVVMTGDDHGSSATEGRFDQYMAASPPGGSVDDWETIRSTSYIYPGSGLLDDEAAAYNAAGFEMGVHLNTGCGNYTASSLNTFFSQQLSQWRANYPSLPNQATHRIHCIAWSGYTILPEIGALHGIRLDTSYYWYPSSWVANRPGLFTGSGMVMRFATTNGNLIDVFQAATQLTDESHQSYPYTVDVLLDRALGPEGYYGAFVALMHTDFNPWPQSDVIIMSATNRGVPVISARQLLTWLDSRNASTIKSINWFNNTETFTVQANASARGLQVMVPVPGGYSVSSLKFNGSSAVYYLRTVKGIQYAFTPATTGSYEVSYVLDTAPPSVTVIRPPAGQTGVSPRSEVNVTFSEPMNASTINSNTVVLLDSVGNSVAATVAYNPSTLTAILKPKSVLRQSETHTAGAEGGVAGVKDVAGNLLTSDFIWSFTTTNQFSYSLWDNTAVPAVPAENDTTALEVGVKFQSAITGYVTGIRFYKGAGNTGTHVGSLWTSSGTLLRQVTFVNETASGWQYQAFATPVAITSNTTYVVSYHTTVGRYSVNAWFFGASGATNYPLRALADGESGGNGLYRYGGIAFPNLTYNAENYWVDVVFKTTLP